MTIVGATLGVEEEYHLVDPSTYELAPRPDLTARVAGGTADPALRAEMLTSQLEAVTAVCATLDDLRASLLAARRTAAAAADEHGALILATSTHPFAARSEIDIAQHPRYERLIDRFGVLPHQFNLVGCHVHVSVPDLDTAIRLMTRARPYLPLLIALTGSSPFHEGVDTAHASYRTAMLGLWPQGGTPPPLQNGQEYLDSVAHLQAAGLIDDASTLLWELRPSTRYPTLEFRVADSSPDLDDVVLLAALVRSLVRTLARDSAAGCSSDADALVRAARWRAARYGLAGELWSFRRHALVPARVAVDDLIAELRDDLDEHGEFNEVSALAAQLVARGTSATRQRAVAERSGDLRAVARDGVELTYGALMSNPGASATSRTFAP